MKTRTTPKSYSNGAGIEVAFFENGEMIGKAYTADFLNEKNSFLHGVEVVEKFRNKGYGSAILDYMINKYDVSRLYVDCDNDIAIQLYKKFGFKVVEEFGGNLKRFVMRRAKMDGGNDDGRV